MTTSVSPKISFEPPLPFTGKHLTGFVFEASRTELSLRSIQKQTQVGPFSDHLTILDSEGRDHKISVSSITQQGSNDYIGLVEQNSANSKSLEEWLGGVRKNQHIQICQNQDIEASDRYTGFSELNFMPSALPEMSWAETDTTCNFLGRRFAYPMLITGMTGGVEKGADINRRLALTAEKLNIPMGIGSQRLALDNPSYSHIFSVKQHAPNIFLIANIGFAQLNLGYDVESCKRAIDMIKADALAIHVNVLQEVIQVEGDRNFVGLLQKIATLCKQLPVPIIIKEVGNGIDPQSAKRLYEAGVSAIDVGGRGGTSWGYIEGLRSHSSGVRHVANTFRNWGIPTAFALAAARKALPDSMNLIATGGVRDGLTVAKAVAMGANMVGIGLPLLRAALSSDEEETSSLLETYAQELRIAMICTGSKKLGDLKDKLHFGMPLSAFTKELFGSENTLDGSKKI